MWCQIGVSSYHHHNNALTVFISCELLEGHWISYTGNTTQDRCSGVRQQMGAGSQGAQTAAALSSITHREHSEMATWHSDHCCYPWWDLITYPINGTLCREARQIHPLHCLRVAAYPSKMKQSWIIFVWTHLHSSCAHSLILMPALTLLILSSLVPVSLQSCCFLPAVIIPDCECSEHRDGVTLGCRNLHSTRYCHCLWPHPVRVEMSSLDI